MLEVKIKKSIKSVLRDKSESINEYIEKKKDSEFRLFYKTIKHSDIPTYAKRTSKDQGLDKNLLYYISAEEMQSIERRSSKKFEVAKQSNINIQSSFFNYVDIKQLERRKGKQKNKHKHEELHDYLNVYLVNDSLTYFNPKYTKKIVEKLGKSFKKDVAYSLDEHKRFTKIDLTHAIHGIGTHNNYTFHQLRGNVFKNDLLYLLVEKDANSEMNLFILFEKNPKFFSILNETNDKWEAYKNKQLEDLNRKTLIEQLQDDDQEPTDEEETVNIGREFQNKWRETLALEMMNYTTEDEVVFCPFTYIQANFENVGTLFRASHIKRFSQCDDNEKFDINNGLLLIANADALFDKYLITVSEDKRLLFSFLLENEYKLKSELNLAQSKIFELILNEERMFFLEQHRKEFFHREELRKKDN